MIARGTGFIEPVIYRARGIRLATAAHPPAFPLYLSALDVIGIHSTLAHRLWTLAPAAVTMVLIGLIGRDLHGPRAGLIGAGVAACSISLIVQDVDLWSEGLYAMLVALTVWCAYRVVERCSPMRVVALSFVIGVTALTRAEGALLMGLLVVLVWRGVAGSRARVRLVALAAIVFAATLAPWFVYNTTRFERPVVLSTNFGPLLWSSNCDSTYNGPNLGGWGFICSDAPLRYSLDESVTDANMREVGLQYISDHVGSLPKVVSVRLLRSFGLWRPALLTDETLFLSEADLGWLVRVAVAQYWILAAVGAFGALRLIRRRQTLVPILAVIGTVVVVSVVGYGSARFRVTLDVMLAILVGVGAVEAWDRWGSGTRASSGTLGA